MLLTYKFRVKDKHAAELNRQARAVNFVWNYCNETQQQAVKRGRKWLTWHDLQKLTAGSSKELGLHAHTIQQICQQYDRSRRHHKKPWIRWRSKRSLGWVPFNTGHVSLRDGAFYFRQQRYNVWLSRNLPEGTKIGAGSFNQDTNGNWYINAPVDIESRSSAGTGSIGIDLGLKSFAVTSNGETVEAQRFYRDLEPALGIAQRAGNKRRVKAIHAKIANRRKDYLHKLSTRIVKENGAVFVGNVNASALAKTRMAKSVLDAGWSAFRAMLEYKAIRHQVLFRDVDEYLTTQICSECGALPDERPKGIGDLGIREWTCGACGARHDRDINAARNILARGHARLAGGIPNREDVNAREAV